MKQFSLKFQDNIILFSIQYLNVPLIEKWINELESGMHKQIFNAYENSEGLCAYYVARIFEPNKEFFNNAQYFQYCVADWKITVNNTLHFLNEKYGSDFIVWLNDDLRLSFNDIAYILRKIVEKYNGN